MQIGKCPSVWSVASNVVNVPKCNTDLVLNVTKNITNRRSTCSTATAVWNLERSGSTLRSYWSIQIHATRNQLTTHERERAYIVKSEVLPRSLEMKTCHRIVVNEPIRTVFTFSKGKVAPLQTADRVWKMFSKQKRSLQESETLSNCKKCRLLQLSVDYLQ